MDITTPMITSHAWIEPTRVVGLAAYATAFLCCTLASIRAGTDLRTAHIARLLALVEAALLIDMAFNWRWKLHQAILEFAMRQHTYDQRSIVQVPALFLLGGLLLLSFLVSRRLLRDRRTLSVAVAGAIVSVILWFVEVVSLDAVDRVLYSSRTGIKAVSFLWIAACVITSIGLLLASRPRGYLHQT